MEITSIKTSGSQCSKNWWELKYPIENADGAKWSDWNKDQWTMKCVDCYTLNGGWLELNTKNQKQFREPNTIQSESSHATPKISLISDYSSFNLSCQVGWCLMGCHLWVVTCDKGEGYTICLLSIYTWQLAQWLSRKS